MARAILAEFEQSVAGLSSPPSDSAAAGAAAGSAQLVTEQPLAAAEPAARAKPKKTKYKEEVLAEARRSSLIASTPGVPRHSKTPPRRRRSILSPA